MYKQFFFHCVKGKLLQHMNTLFLSILLASFFSPPIGMLKINAALERLMKKKPEKFRLLIRHIFTLAKQIIFRRWKLENSINFVSQVRTWLRWSIWCGIYYWKTLTPSDESDGNRFFNEFIFQMIFLRNFPLRFIFVSEFFSLSIFFYSFSTSSSF